MRSKYFSAAKQLKKSFAKHSEGKTKKTKSPPPPSNFLENFTPTEAYEPDSECITCDSDDLGTMKAASMARFLAKRPHSTKKKEINWEVVRKLLMAGCHGQMIAAVFDIHIDNFYERARKESGIDFSEYKDRNHQIGKAMILLRMFELALAGDRSISIWWSKNMCGWKEPAPANAENCPSDMLKAFIVQVKDLVDKETSGHSAVAKTSIIDSD